MGGKGSAENGSEEATKGENAIYKAPLRGVHRNTTREVDMG